MVDRRGKVERVFGVRSGARVYVHFSVIAFFIAAVAMVVTWLTTEPTNPLQLLLYQMSVLAGLGFAFVLARKGHSAPGFALLMLTGTAANCLLPFMVPVAATPTIFAFNLTMVFLLGLHPCRTYWRFPLVVGTAILTMTLVATRFYPGADQMTLVVLAMHAGTSLMTCLIVSYARHSLRERNKATQAQLFATDRMASLGVIAAGLGHEINNPLAYIQLNLRSVLGGDHLEVDDRDALADAMEGARRIEHVVKNLGFFARPDSSTVVLEVKQILETTIGLVRPQVRHDGHIAIESEEYVYIEDANGRLGQVALNLLGNAIQAAQGRGGHAEIRVRVSATDERVHIAFDDNGPGVPEALRVRIFDSFFTTKGAGEGTGLGLAICQHLVQDAGGQIRVSDSDMGGARFEIDLPRAYPEADVFKRTPPPPGATKPQVLIIDDDQRVASAMARALRDTDVEVALSGREGLAHLSGGAYDVIFCDVMMPELNGLEVFRAASKDNAGNAERFYFVTGGAYAGIRPEDLEATGRPVLRKPVKADVLRRTVFDAVSDRHAAAPVGPSRSARRAQP